LTYYAGSTASGTVLASAPTAAGIYTVVASFAGSADYAAVSASTIFTIAKAMPKITVSDMGGTYNGQPFSATATVAGVVSGVDSNPSASLEGVSPTITYYLLNADGTKTLLTGAPSSAGRYQAVASFAGSADYAAASRSLTFTIKKATPLFSLLTSPTISKGTANTVLSGNISLSSLIPAGEQVKITVNGVTVIAIIQANGSFSATIATGSLGIGKHTITYSYAGDGDFNAISENQTLTVTL
jgi:hypothetical protein